MWRRDLAPRKRYSPNYCGSARVFAFRPWNGVLSTSRELGIKIIVYSPLGRGLLTGRYVSALKVCDIATSITLGLVGGFDGKLIGIIRQKSPDDFEENDFRRTLPKLVL